jgi:phage shock protein A
MVDQDAPDPQFDAMTARLLRREALRRAAEELNTTSGPGLEGALAQISAEVTAEAAAAREARHAVPSLKKLGPL